MVLHENDHEEVAPHYAMENADWVHEGQGGCAKSMDAPTLP